MANPDTGSHPHVRVTPATRDQEPVLANLLELYTYDFSDIHPARLGPDGRFGYKHLSSYWSNPDRHPFLLTVNSCLAGLALIQRDSQPNAAPIWDVAEFFVLRSQRRRGVGIAAAHQLWAHFPGAWQVRVMASNLAALAFWQRAVTAYAGFTIEPHKIEPNKIEKDGRSWLIFSFASPAGAKP